jgi:hypothetical protein
MKCVEPTTEGRERERGERERERERGWEKNLRNITLPLLI